MQARLRIGLAALAAATAHAHAPSFRLPGDAVPGAYDGEIRFNTSLTAFDATLRIDVRVLRPLTTLWLHAKDLEIQNAVFRQGGRTWPADVDLQSPGFAGFHSESGLQTGSASLEIRFRWRLKSPGGSGLFRREHNGGVYLLTQFETEYARTVFPCFDEPRFKAAWRLAIVVPRGIKAFANAPLESERPDGGGGTRFQFASSKPLPPYLVSIAAGPFEEVSARPAGARRTPIRVLTPRGEASSAEFAAATIPAIVDWFEKYLQSSYPFEKLDFVAIPGCSSGAMEHPGLVTFCRPHLLQPPSEDTGFRQRSFTRVAAHEIAHQWFGNSVTPGDWADIWLSEGFANWLQGEFLDSVHPDWNYRSEELRQRYVVMAADLAGASRHLNRPVHSSQDVSEALSPIAYVKGAAVLRMMHEYSGARFLSALRTYLRRFAYASAASADLVEAVRQTCGRRAAGLLAGYVERPGVPVVTASEECAGARGTLRFRSGREPMALWFRAGGRTMLAARDASAFACDSAPLLNPAGIGYWLAGYSEAQLREVFRKTWKHLSDTERAALLYDLLLLRSQNRVPAALVLELLDGRTSQLDSAGALAAVDLVNDAAKMVPGQRHPEFAVYIRDNFGDRPRAIGWLPRPPDSVPDRQLRPALIRLAVSSGDARLIGEALSLATRWLDRRESTPPDMVAVILTAAAHSGDSALLARLASALETPAAESAIEPRAMAAALGTFRSTGGQQQAIAFLADSSKPWPWRLALLEAFLAPDPGLPERISLIRDRWEQIVKAIPPPGRDALWNAVDASLSKSCAAEAVEAWESWRATSGWPGRAPPCTAQRSGEAPAITRLLAAR